MRDQLLDSHLEPRLVAAYLEGLLGAQEREEVEDHLTACADCRREVVAVGRLVQGRRRARRAVPTLGMAAAAVLALVVGVSVITGPEDVPSGGAVRAPSLAEDRALIAVKPLPDATLERDDAIRFVWREAAPGSTYRLAVLDEAGGILWSAETGDTVAILPTDVRLDTGGTYFWIVDALSSDGLTLTSGARRFSLR